MDKTIFVIIWSIGIGAFAVWFAYGMTHAERDTKRKNDNED